jgi:putative membrane protein insertion efficiency factor
MNQAPTRNPLVRLLVTVMLLPIKLYRTLISPLKPQPTCRFHPTCSRYAHDAILAHGPLKGTGLAVVRVAKCHPWHPGGLDPVPPTQPTAPRPARDRLETPS